MNFSSIELIKSSWQDLKENWKPFYTVASIYGISLLAIQIVAELLAFVHLGLLGGAISAIFSILLGGGFIFFLLKFIKRESVQIIDLFRLFEDMGLGANYVVMSILKSALVAIGFLLLFIPGVYLAVGYIFAPYLVIDKGFSPWQALEESRKRVHKNWFQFFIFVLVLAVLNIIGAIPLGLGLIVTIPITYVATTKLYGLVFGEEV